MGPLLRKKQRLRKPIADDSCWERGVSGGFGRRDAASVVQPGRARRRLLVLASAAAANAFVSLLNGNLQLVRAGWAA